MKIFISWSGSRSRAVAEALRHWLPLVIQSVEPWMSEEDINKGERWSSVIADELEKTAIGIICLTPENLDFPSPWMFFETGALSKILEKSLVCPYLFEIEKNEVKGPLGQFQATKADKIDTKKLVDSINNVLEKPLGEKQLDNIFNHLWPDLEKRLRRISNVSENSEKRLTMRGLPLSEALDRVGLVDIENRDDFQYELPPTKFYEQANNEVFIAGPSLYMTFHKHIDLVKILLSENKQIYTMILHPDSDDVVWLSDREERSIRDDIMATIRTIKKTGLYKSPTFLIKFMSKLPPFIGVMIDGDLTGNPPKDIHGQIRVQPNNLYVTGHKGVILQLKKIVKTSTQPAGAFDFFSQDFREIWKKDARECPDFFE